ncbi:uncharacterized protein ACR2FA_007664 [Aphomia sociella]
MELYAAMRSTHHEMSSLGQKAALPPADDLRIMNVAKLTPEQLLQLCANLKPPDDNTRDDCQTLKSTVTFDINKLYNMPTKLVATCEQTLTKRKEMIDWFEALKTVEKGIGMNKLSKKLNEFNAENEMLVCSLDKVKTDVYAELNEIVDFLRKCVNETIALQLRTEELTYELSELNSRNIDLRKQMHNANHMKSQSNKHRLEELEKELKEENCKKIIIKDRLTRAEGQIKIGVERVSQLEAALDQARVQTWTLERTVQQLHEQNQKLQVDFDKELNKLTESIRENTVHLEEIAHARETLQAEKEDLEKRLNDLSEHYNESLKNMKHEMNVNIVKVIETDKKFQEEKEGKKILEEKLESLCAQLLESQLRNKDLYKELEDKELKLGKFMSYQEELKETRCKLNDANIQVEEYRKQLIQQNEVVKEIEHNFNKSLILEENLKLDLSKKEEYITELENKQSLLEQQLQESENKMYSYEEQLNSLKQEITQLKADFGEFENLNELHEMINQQRNKLLEATRQNGDLAEALQKKDLELERQSENITEQEQLLEERDGIIKILSKKYEEQTSNIKLLRNNLEMRAQADIDLNQQLVAKNSEVESLLNNLETRKHEVSQLENIILTLKDQTRNMNVQRLNDREKITELESKIQEYKSLHFETKRGVETPTDNLDNLIKILENELGMPLESDLNIEEKGYPTSGRYGDHKKRDKHESYDYRDSNNTLYHPEPESIPTKIVTGNFVKKTYMSTNDKHFKTENLDRKKTLRLLAPDPELNVFDSVSTNKEKYQSLRGVMPLGHGNDNYLANFRYAVPNQLQHKKCKMFKLAGHRL